MTLFQSIVTQIRQDRAANKIDRSQSLNAEIRAEGQDYVQVNEHRDAISRLGNVSLTLTNGGPFALTLNIPVDRARLEKENEGLEKQIANLDRQFANEQFMAKAPEKVIAGMRQKKAEYEAQLAKNRAAL
jgi:valyl-tRNA synthetase